MTVIQVTANGGHALNPAWPRRELRHTLEPALAAIPDGEPIVIYVHGHENWPPDDVLLQAREKPALSINFNWPAKARFAGVVPDAVRLYDQAGQAAGALADLINLLGELAPDHRIDLMGHSLGARSCLSALPLLKHPNISRLICLSAVEFSAITLLALQVPVARKIAFYNVTSPRQPVFHRLMHHFGPRPGPSDRLLSTGFAFPRKNWLDIRLDNPVVRRPLADLCGKMLDMKPGMPKPALIYQLEAVFLQNRARTGFAEMRQLLGSAIPGPLSMIPLRMPR